MLIRIVRLAKNNYQAASYLPRYRKRDYIQSNSLCYVIDEIKVSEFVGTPGKAFVNRKAIKLADFEFNALKFTKL